MAVTSLWLPFTIFFYFGVFLCITILSRERFLIPFYLARFCVDCGYYPTCQWNRLSFYGAHFVVLAGAIRRNWRHKRLSVCDFRWINCPIG